MENGNRPTASSSHDLQAPLLAQEEAVEDVPDAIADLCAYISASRNQIEGPEWTITRVAQAIAKENPNVPLMDCIVKEGTSFQLTFKSKKDRDSAAVRAGYSIEGIQVSLDPPRRTYKQTIYIFGIPNHIPDSSGKEWLSSCGAQTDSDFRKLCIPETVRPDKPNGVWNGGRSVVVDLQKKVAILGFSHFLGRQLRSRPKVNIWYSGIGVWSQYCEKCGHRAADCAERISKNGAVMTDLFEELEEWKKAYDKLCAEYGDKIEWFYLKENPFSNHYLRELEIDGKSYQSTEHYLFSERAVHCQQPELAEEIRKELMVGKAMRASQKIDFPGGVKELLEICNGKTRKGKC